MGKVRDSRPRRRRRALERGVTRLAAVIEENVVAQVGRASKPPRSKTAGRTVVCENPHLAPKFLREEELRLRCESSSSGCCKSPAHGVKPWAPGFAIPQPPVPPAHYSAKYLSKAFPPPVPRQSLSCFVSPALSHSLTWCKRSELPRGRFSAVCTAASPRFLF